MCMCFLSSLRFVTVLAPLLLCIIYFVLFSVEWSADLTVGALICCKFQENQEAPHGLCIWLACWVCSAMIIAHAFNSLLLILVQFNHSNTQKTQNFIYVSYERKIAHEWMNERERTSIQNELRARREQRRIMSHCRWCRR